MHSLLLFILNISYICALLPAPFTHFEWNFYKHNLLYDIVPDVDAKLSSNDLNNSLAYTRQNLIKLYQFEKRLHAANIQSHPKSLNYNYQQLHAPNEEAIEIEKYSYLVTEAFLYLKNIYCLKYRNADACTNLLQMYGFKGTEFNGRCGATKTHCNDNNSKYRSIDGECNNVKDATIGRSLTVYKRYLPADYLDGAREIRRSVYRKFKLPSARLISQAFVSHAHNLSDFTLLLMQWGEFIRNDLTHTVTSTMLNSAHNEIDCCSANGMKLLPRHVHPFCAPIEVSANDRFYGKLYVRCLSYVRSATGLHSECKLQPNEQLNQATHFLDASTIYHRATNREMIGGRLKAARINGREFFETDDVRAQHAHPHLSILHTIWMREHNRIARALAAIHPQWNDAKLFEEARRIVIAEIQHITYREWLPIILGDEYMSKIMNMSTYHPAIDPSVSNSFATAAFRFIESMMVGNLSLLDANRKTIGNFLLRDVYQNAKLIEQPDMLMKLLVGLVTQRGEHIDAKYTPDVTNYFYTTNKDRYGYDAFSFDIQRGRDHGLPGYAAFRKLCGVGEAESFEDFAEHITPNNVKLLRTTYKHFKDVDLLVGGLLEESHDGSLLGPTFSCLIADQFMRTRLGDRFFYEFNDAFTKRQLHELQKVNFAQILCANNHDDLQQIQNKAFYQINANHNPIIECKDVVRDGIDFDMWSNTYH